MPDPSIDALKKPIIELPKEHPDWALLEAQPPKEDWPHAKTIRAITQNSTAAQKKLPIDYMGSLDDVLHAMAFADWEGPIVFRDFVYATYSGKLCKPAQPDKMIKRIGGKIISITIEGRMGNKGKRTIVFEWGGKKRTLIQYADDATKYTPPEVAENVGFAMMIAPTQFNRVGSTPDQIPNHLRNSDNLSSIYQRLAIDGFIHWDPLPDLNPELLGFTKLKTQSIHNPHPLGLYQKTSNIPPEEIKSILSFYSDFNQAISARYGATSVQLKNESLDDYAAWLNIVREHYNSLPQELQKKLKPSLHHAFLGNTISPRQLYQFIIRGKQFGIKMADDGKTLTPESRAILSDYILRSNDVVRKAFPEIVNLELNDF